MGKKEKKKMEENKKETKRIIVKFNLSKFLFFIYYFKNKTIYSLLKKV